MGSGWKQNKSFTEEGSDLSLKPTPTYVFLPDVISRRLFFADKCECFQKVNSAVLFVFLNESRRSRRKV